MNKEAINTLIFINVDAKFWCCAMLLKVIQKYVAVLIIIVKEETHLILKTVLF